MFQKTAPSGTLESPEHHPESILPRNARNTFADRLLAWYDVNGRRELPWKVSRDPYRIWVSEIMLQQTQVATVLGYYARFIDAFPDVAALAAADLDDVLAHWAGLGYYARARNLHRAARQVADDHGGVFPGTIDELTALPGVGRSTAAAILALSTGAPHAILDGNVRRVLSRVHRVEGDPGSTTTTKRLWQLAEELTPHERVDDYTQAVMDLGAMVCTRRPRCEACPVDDLCEGRACGDAAEFPGKRARRERPRRSSQFLLLTDGEGRLLLERRPPSGIWGGLWCPPQVESAPADWIRRELGRVPGPLREFDPFVHKFTHFDLEIRPAAAMLEQPVAFSVGDGDDLRWHTPAELAGAGMPAPFRKLIDSLDPEDLA